MADRLRIVTFSAGGRPIVQLDLADGATYALQRDTPNFTPPTRRQEWSSSSNRYGGARLAHEAHDNGSFTAQWYISGANQDTALANRDAFWDQLESLGTGRYLEYRPDSASRSTYYEIRGPAPWADQYRWIEFASGSKLSVQAGFIIAPLGEGERMLIDDPFDVNSLTDYTLAHGTTLTFAAGACTTASTTEWDLIHSARGYSYGDAQATFVYTTGTTVTGGLSRAILSWIDDNNYLFAEVAAAGTLKLWKRDVGVNTQLATAAATALSPSTKYTVAIREEGNIVYVEHWIGTPTLGAPTVTTNATLAGADATKFGFGATGKPGFGGTWPTPTAWQANEFSLEPYTYVGRTPPQAIQLGGAIPGRAPARTDVVFSYSAAASVKFVLAAWEARGTVPFGVTEAETASLLTFASTADANARGGNLAQATTSGAGTAGVTIPITPTFPAATTLQQTYAMEVWARVKAASTVVTPNIAVSFVPQSGMGGVIYPMEWGQTGTPLTFTGASTPYYFVRLGTLLLGGSTVSGGTLQLLVTWAAGSSGALGIDYVLTVPADQRTASTTGKASSTTAIFWQSGFASGNQVIRADLSTVTQYATGSPVLPVSSRIDAFAPGPGGAQIEIPPGNTDIVFHSSSQTPNETGGLNSDVTQPVVPRIAFHPVPRYFLPRGS